MAESPRAKKIRRTAAAAEHIERALGNVEAAVELANEHMLTEAQTWALISIANSNAATAIYTRYSRELSLE